MFLEPFRIRLRPRDDASQRVVSFVLRVEGPVAGRADLVDAFGNDVSEVWFEGLTDALDVVASSVVDTRRENPFEFLAAPGSELLPPVYRDDERPGLAPYMTPSGAAAAAYAASTPNRDSGVMGFLGSLCSRLYEEFDIVVREEGDAMAADDALTADALSCRDVAVLFVEVCRAAGIAARFVSGYQEGDRDQDTRYMHAWAEAYVPGGGWRGYDPTHGLAVADRHVAVASGPTAASAAPTSGSFRGTGSASTMASTLELRVDEPPSDGQQSQSQSSGP